MVINGKRSEREQGGVAREASDQVTLVQPPPLSAGVSGDRQVKMTDDTGVERRAGEGSTGRYWGTGQRDRGTVESCQESPESPSQNSGFTF